MTPRGGMFTFPYVPLINGSDTNFSHPYVLTYPQNGNPTDKPRPQLVTQNLHQFSRGSRWFVTTTSCGPPSSASCGKEH